jgi:hypothetical protein
MKAYITRKIESRRMTGLERETPRIHAEANVQSIQNFSQFIGRNNLGYQAQMGIK